MALPSSSATKLHFSRYNSTFDRSRVIPYAVFLGSCLFLFILEFHFKPQGYMGFYFQSLTSDIMMQTLTVAMINAEPVKSLYYLHIQPPMLDTIRTILVMVSPTSHPVGMLQFVDGCLYLIWLLLFGVLNTLIYAWVTQITKSMAAGITAVIIWLFHPAAILYATMLDGTFLSTILITWMIYETWLLSKNQGSCIRLGLASSLAFLTRTVFQWYFAPVLGLSLLLLPIKKRKVLLALLIFCPVVVLYCGKQYLLFHTLSTTTFGGYHKTGIIWYEPEESEVQEYLARIQAEYPEGAKSILDRHNNEMTWKHHLAHDAIFSAKLKEDFYFSLRQIFKSLNYNFNNYWQPSSRYTDNVITSNLSWRNAYEWLFSKWRLWLLLMMSLMVWFVSGGKQDSQRIWRFLGLSVMIGYILMITHLCNRLEWTEAYRLKFFLEPVFFVFIMSQLTFLIKSLVGKARRLP